MKILIVGRTATGKDTLREILQKDYNLKFVCSHTTRPKRTATENTHVFITQEEADKVPIEDKVARTVIDGNEYFTTRKQVEEADAYIIDPNGLKMLIKNMPDTVFEIVYMKASDKELQREMAIKRADDPEAAAKIFESRYNSEAPQFDAFEQELANNTFGNQTNCTSVLTVNNTYDEECLQQTAFDVIRRRTLHRNVIRIVQDLMDLGLLQTKNGKVQIQVQPEDNGEPTTILLTKEIYANYMLIDKDMFYHVLITYMSTPHSFLDDII